MHSRVVSGSSVIPDGANFVRLSQEKKWPPKRWQKPPADYDLTLVMTTTKWSSLWVKDEAEEEEHSAEDFPTPRRAAAHASGLGRTTSHSAAWTC